MNFPKPFCKNLSRFVSLTLLFVSCSSPEPIKQESSTTPDVGIGINWPSFLSRHDPIWETTPKTWMEGVFIGNGRLGAMIYRGDEEAEPAAEVLAWTVSRADLYDDREPADSTRHGDRNRMPVGRLHLCPEGEVTESRARIDLWNGEARGSLTTDKGQVKWTSWVQPGEVESGVVVIVVETDEPERGTCFQWQPFRSMVPRYHARPVEGYVPNPKGTLKKRADAEVWVQPFLVGGDYATAWKTVPLGENRSVTFLAIGDGRVAGGSEASALAAVEKAASRGLEAMQKENRDWWHSYYPKSFVSIPDARIESHYWIQMYKLGAATRKNGVVTDTCGPWLKVDTVWPKCWWNLNMQLTHYPVPVANHLELGEPLFRLLKQELNNGNLIRNVPEELRHDSAYFGNPTTTYNLINDDVYWLGGRMPGPLGRRGARLNQLPWICHTLWEYYRRSMDDEFLRDTLFPLTRRGYNFLFHFLEEGDDGRLHVQDTFSSEYGTAYDANEAIAMVQWGTSALLWMNDRLGLDHAEADRWKDIRKRLVEPPVDETGLRIGADVALEHGHRHYSHLMSLVPFRTWDFQGEESRALAYRSLEHFLHFKGGLAGYSFTGASSMYSALGDGDKALETLKRYYGRYDRVNTMYTETNPPSPVIETPLSAARCVQDMLLQSHDLIRVFPAVPSDWKDASFHRLLAEGAFEVSAQMRDGKTEFVRVLSKAGEPCQLKVTNFSSPRRWTPSGLVPLPTSENGVLTLDLKKGEEALLVAGDFDSSSGPSIRPVEQDESLFNPYGVKEVE